MEVVAIRYNQVGRNTEMTITFSDELSEAQKQELINSYYKMSVSQLVEWSGL